TLRVPTQRREIVPDDPITIVVRSSCHVDRSGRSYRGDAAQLEFEREVHQPTQDETMPFVLCAGCSQDARPEHIACKRIIKCVERPRQSIRELHLPVTLIWTRHTELDRIVPR